MMRREIAERMNELVSLSQQMDSADLSIEDIRTSLELLKPSFSRLSLEVDALLKGPLARLSNARWTFKLVIVGQLTLPLSTEDHLLPTTLTIPDRCPFQTLPPLLFQRLQRTWRAFRPFLSLYLILWHYFETPT